MTVALTQGKKVKSEKAPDWIATAQGIGKPKAKAAPKGVPDGALAYMIHTEANEGTLTLQFVKHNEGVIDGTLAYFAPKDKIPDFKFSNQGGKSVMSKNANLAAGKKAYLNGFC